MERENLATCTEVVIGQMKCVVFRNLQVLGYPTAHQYCKYSQLLNDICVDKRLSQKVILQEDAGLVSTGVSNDDADSLLS